MSHIKPADRHPVAGQTITLESTRVIVVPVITPAANAHAIHPGRVNYLGKTKPNKAPPVPTAPVTRRIERKVFAKGQYFGNSERMFAFVMLDEDTAPKVSAANDPKMD